MKKLTNEVVLRQINQIWKDKFDLSLVNYTTGRNKIRIICKTHGAFEVTLNNFVGNKSGCPICGGTYLRTQKGFNLTTEWENNKYRK